MHENGQNAESIRGALKLQWCIFEKVVSGFPDEVPGVYWQHTLGTFNSKQEAERKIKRLQGLPEFKGRELFTERWRIG